MQIPVLIESVPAGGFQARGGEPFPVVASGATPQDALAQLKDCITAKLRAGARVASIDIQPGEHPWLPFAGMFPETDPIVTEWLDTIRLERRSCRRNGMSLYVLDTDLLSLFQRGDAAVCKHVAERSPDELAVTIITVEEQLSGWYTLRRRVKGREKLASVYERFAENVRFFARLQILSFTEQAIDQYE